MSSRTWASNAGGGGDLYIRSIHTMYVGNFSSVANRAFAMYFQVPVDCTVAAISVASFDKEAGNVMVGIYDSAFSRLCVTNATAVAGLANSHNWLVPTTLPALTAGYYWIAVVCDQDYVNGASGISFSRTENSLNNAADNGNLGNQWMVHMDGAYPLPDPFVPINNSDITQILTGLRVTL